MAYILRILIFFINLLANYQVDGVCTYQGQNYELQYTLPSNNQMKGTEFSCDLIRYFDIYNFLNQTTFIDLATTDIPNIKIVTAFNEKSRKRAGYLLKTFKSAFRGQRMIVYDLGLKKATVKKLSKYSFVEYRKFQFSNFPTHVRNLQNAAYKLIIIAEVLKEYPYIMWANPTLRFTMTGFMNRVDQLISCYKGKPADQMTKQPQYITERNNKKFKEIVLPTCAKCQPKYQTNGYNPELFKFNVDSCYKSNMLLTIPSNHGILSTIPDSLKKYIPTDANLFQQNTELQFTTGIIFIVRTQNTIQNMMSWALLCALTKDCIEPIQVKNECSYDFGNLFSKNFVCPAADQGLLTLLLHNANNYDYRNYITDIFNYAKYGNKQLKKWKKLRKG
uniref:CAP domain-containing protein n=1 Tax=Strongyloides venezuelensis TaxID=75913 RepID=A0A0K0F415_STRVS